MAAQTCSNVDVVTDVELFESAVVVLVGAGASSVVTGRLSLSRCDMRPTQEMFCRAKGDRLGTGRCMRGNNKTTYPRRFRLTPSRSVVSSSSTLSSSFFSVVSGARNRRSRRLLLLLVAISGGGVKRKSRTRSVYFLCTMIAYVLSGSKERSITGSVLAGGVVMVGGGEVEVAGVVVEGLLTMV
jgi:hypothetical protein